MKSKKIIITGGLGYIGMELALILSGISRQNDILVIDNTFSAERVSQLKRWGMSFKQIDILDIEALSGEIMMQILFSTLPVLLMLVEHKMKKIQLETKK